MKILNLKISRCRRLSASESDCPYRLRYDPNEECGHPAVQDRSWHECRIYAGTSLPKWCPLPDAEDDSGKAVDAHGARLRQTIKAMAEFCREATLPPYEDSDAASLLAWVRARAGCVLADYEEASKIAETTPRSPDAEEANHAQD
jgi:hypothetical protein